MSNPADCSQRRLKPRQCLESPASIHDSDEEPSAAQNDEDDCAAQSDDSSATQEEPVETILAESEAARQQKMRLGGRPTRTIKEYRPEDVNLIPMASDHPRAKLYPGLARPAPQRTIPWEKTLYRTYCAEERMYFRSELLAWESFLRSIRRDWARRDEAAGGTIPPPPPVLEWDPLDLHTRYLEFLKQIRADDENAHENSMILSRFNFWPYYVSDEPKENKLQQAKTPKTSSLNTNPREDDVSESDLVLELTSSEFSKPISRRPLEPDSITEIRTTGSD